VVAVTAILAGCSGNPPDASKETDPFAQMTPEANIQPLYIDPGQLDSGERSSDVWTGYRDGKKTGERLVLTYVLGSGSLFSIDLLDENGNKVDDRSQFTNVESEDRHLATPEDAEGARYDIVFNDNFTAYDYVSDTWYTRGDMKKLLAAFPGTWTSSQNGDFQLTFKEDGTFESIYRGEANGVGSYTMKAGNVVQLQYDDREWASRKVEFADDGKLTVIDVDYLRYKRQ
ncbi:MAG: hypothetical protein SOW20_03880, partial [Berryella intestinalis]|uniref:hypothetical protein n=1 Tax=Berryella intestinalis TaxID=1531429 RepID=UPI002A7619ED